MSAALTTRIPIRNSHGQTVDEKEVATYAGLLARAHDEGLASIVTQLVQVPTEANGMLAIVLASVQTKRGVFTGLGDASPTSVNRRIIPHIVRMAETRAKARALRDAVNIGLVALEELGGDEGVSETSTTNVRALPTNRQALDNTMTASQRRYLYRLLAEAGHEGDEATQVLLDGAGLASLAQVTKSVASRLIDVWKQEVGRA